MCILPWFLLLKWKSIRIVQMSCAIVLVFWVRQERNRPPGQNSKKLGKLYTQFSLSLYPAGGITAWGGSLLAPSVLAWGTADAGKVKLFFLPFSVWLFQIYAPLESLNRTSELL